MKLGDRGSDVRELQTYLKGLGYLKDGEYNYGPKTKAAVMAFQDDLGYRSTGVWEDDLSLIYDIFEGSGSGSSGSQGSCSGSDTPVCNESSFCCQEGDRVVITGENPHYGGIGGDFGISIPNSQLGGKEHTVLQISDSRNEVLLKEIYSWVPAEFIELSMNIPNDKSITDSSSSNVKSSLVTKTSNKKQNSKRRTINIDTIPCYVTNLNTNTTTDFEISPETITDNVMANFEDQIPKSRTSPFKAYSSSGPRDISFTVSIFDDYCKLGIVKTVRRLQALTVPTKAGGYVKEPRCKVRVGDFLDITGVCLSVSVEWAKPYKDRIYSKADVSLTFNEVEDVSRFADAWEAMG